jgi:hypothetical protein
VSETFKTELVVTNLAAGGGGKAPDLQAMIEGIVRKHGIAADPKRDLAQAVSSPAVTTLVQDLVNALARITGKRASDPITAKGAPFKVQKLSPTGAPLYTDEGEAIYETHTPKVKFTVKSDPNIHKTDEQIAREVARAKEKLTGEVVAPTEEEKARAIALTESKTATAEEMAEAADIIRRGRAARSRARTGKSVDATASADKEAERTRRLGARAMSRYGEKAAESLAGIDREMTLLQGRVQRSGAAYPVPQDAQALSNAMGQFRGMSLPEQFSSAGKDLLAAIKDLARDVKKEYRIAASEAEKRARKDADDARNLAQKKSDNEKKNVDRAEADARKSAQRKADNDRKDAEVDAAARKRAAERLQRRQEEVAAREEINDKVAERRLERIKSVNDVKETAKDASEENQRRRKKERREETAAERAAASQLSQRTSLYGSLANVATNSAGALFTKDGSVLGSALGGTANLAANYFQFRGLQTMMAGGAGGGGMFLAATVAKAAVSMISAGLERGKELREMVDPIYREAEPGFVRESLQRRMAYRFGTEDLSALAVADAGRAGNRDMVIDNVEDVVTNRLNSIRKHLGPFMGLNEAFKQYNEFNSASGIIGAQLNAGLEEKLPPGASGTELIARALATGARAGLSTDLLAMAARAGAMPGQRGGEFREGADGTVDIGTLRHQQETLLRARIQGAPANQIMQETLQRQSALAAHGIRTDFDRDALMQKVLQTNGVPMQQYTNIANTLEGMRAQGIERQTGPRKQALSSLLEAAAYSRGGDIDEVLRYRSTTSMAEQIQNARKAGILSDEMLRYGAGGLSPADQQAVFQALKDVGAGATEGKALATGEATLSQYEFLRIEAEGRGTWAGVGGQRDLNTADRIARFKERMDEVSKMFDATSDALKDFGASLGNVGLAAGDMISGGAATGGAYRHNPL